MIKKIILIASAVVAISISASSFALDFSYDNYSNAAQLKYSYTLPGQSWQSADPLAPMGYKTLKFAAAIPSAWKIDVADGGKLQCVDYYTRRPSNNIIALKNKDFAAIDGLLLDILAPNAKNTGGEFLAYIITTDGGGFNYYSNVIDCIAEEVTQHRKW